MSITDATVELLQRFVDDRLDEAGRKRVEQLLSTDAEARQLVAVLRALRRESKKDTALRTAARSLTERLIRDIRSGKRRPKAPQGVLTFDSGLLPLPAGVRPATVDGRRLRYSVGEHQLELSMYPASPETFEIIGQISGYAEGKELEAALEGKHRKLHVTSNRFQVFHFTRVPSGEYTLTLSDDSGARAVVSIDV